MIHCEVLFADIGRILYIVLCCEWIAYYSYSGRKREFIEDYIYVAKSKRKYVMMAEMHLVMNCLNIILQMIDVGFHKASIMRNNSEV